MSIFRKDCPRCGEANTATANACGCGFIFAADLGSHEAVELESQEQELYEAYLAARLEQARRAAELAIESLAANPMDEVRAAEADRANQAFEEINNEYESQLGTVDNARQEADKARRQADVGRRQQAALTAERARTLAREKEKTDSEQRKRITLVERPALTTRQVAEKAVADFQQLDPIIESKPTTRDTSRNRAGRNRLNATEAIRARREAQALIAQKAAAVSGRRSTQIEMPPQLRREVRDKAEQVVQIARQSLERITSDLAAAAQALGGDSAPQNQHQFRQAQQQRAAGSQGKSGPESTECPNCTAPIASSSTSCQCGYLFTSASTEMPGLSLSAVDVAKLSEII